MGTWFRIRERRNTCLPEALEALGKWIPATNSPPDEACRRCPGKPHSRMGTRQQTTDHPGHSDPTSLPSSPPDSRNSAVGWEDLGRKRVHHLCTVCVCALSTYAL